MDKKTGSEVYTDCGNCKEEPANTALISKPIRVVITNLDHGQDYTQDILRMREMGYEVDWKIPRDYSPKETVKATLGYNAIMAGGEKYDRWALNQLKGSLKIITRHGTGIDNIDLEAARELGIAVTNAPGRNARAVAEHCLGMIIGLMRKVVFYDREIRQGRWSISITSELYGKTIGIIGFGAAGKWLSRLMKGFDCKIYAYDKHFDYQYAEAMGVDYAEIPEILEKSDVVSLHIPLTSETHDSIGLEFFSKMKKTAIFINASRGKIVREAEMIKALQEGIIAGAGLDVYANPPLTIDHPLCHMDNVILSPHTSAVTYEAMDEVMECCLKDMNDFFAGKIPVNILNPGYEKNRRY